MGQLSSRPESAAPKALIGAGPAVEEGDAVRQVLRDCLLLCCASQERDVAGCLRKHGHRFSAVSASEDAEGRFIVAEVDPPGGGEKFVFLAVRGSETCADWQACFDTWPELFAMGLPVHPSWYCRSSLLPLQYLMRRADEGFRPICTGHGVGGAVAQVLAQQLLTHGQSGAATALDRAGETLCVAFAGPAPFPGPLARELDGRHRKQFFNFVRGPDVVPRLATWLHHLLRRAASAEPVPGCQPLGEKEGRRLCEWARGMLRGIASPAASGRALAEELAAAPKEALKKLLVEAGCHSLELQPGGAADFVTYEPVGRCIPLDADDQHLQELSDQQVRDYFDGSSAPISQEALQQHSLSHFAPLLQGMLTGAQPELLLGNDAPPPVVGLAEPHVVSMQVTTTPTSLRILLSGERLAAARWLQAKAFLKDRVELRSDMMDLTSATLPISAWNGEPIPGVCAITIWTSMGVEWPQEEVTVRTDRLSAIHLAGVQDLLQKAVHLAIYSKKSHPTLHKKLSKLLGEMCLTVPGELLLPLFVGKLEELGREGGVACGEIARMATKKVGYHVLNRLLNPLPQPLGRGRRLECEALTTAVQEGLEGNGWGSWINADHYFSDVCIAELLEMRRDPTELGSLMVHELTRQVQEEEDNIRAGVPGALCQYAEALNEMLRNVSREAASPLADFIGESLKTEDRELDAILFKRDIFAFHAVRTVAVGISSAVSAGLVAGPTYLVSQLAGWGMVMLLPSIIPAGLVAVGLGAFFAWECTELRFSMTRREALLNTLGLDGAERAPVPWCITEDKVDKELRRHGFRSTSPASECPVSNLEGGVAENHRRRLKLVLLVRELRHLLHETSPVLLLGPSGAGKSSLIDGVRGHSLQDALGGNLDHKRTSLPSVYPCAWQGVDFTMMDTVGLTDVMFAVSEAGKPKLTSDAFVDIFSSLASMVVYVVPLARAGSEAAISCHTATSSKALANHPLRVPTLTCFSNSDDGTGEYPEWHLQELEAQERMSKAQGRPLELEQAGPAPRVLSCFLRRRQPDKSMLPVRVPSGFREALPPGMARFFVWTQEDVASWIVRVRNA